MAGTLKKGTFKKLFGKTRVEVLNDLGPDLVTVSIGGRALDVRRKDLR